MTPEDTINLDNCFWQIQLDLTEPSPSDVPPEGILKFDLRIIETSMVASIDTNWKTHCHQRTEIPQIETPTRNFPGNMNPEQCYSDLNNWIQSLQLPITETLRNNFVDYVIESVFQRDQGDGKLTIAVSAVLYHILPDFIPHPDGDLDPMELDDDEEGLDDEEETDDDEEEEEGLNGDEELDDYDYEKEVDGLDDYWIHKMRDLHAVFATEEHRKIGDCSICLSDLVSDGDYKENKNLFKSLCGHLFHDECMTEWLRYKDSCPLCRFVLSAEMEEDELVAEMEEGDLVADMEEGELVADMEEDELVADMEEGDLVADMEEGELLVDMDEDPT